MTQLHTIPLAISQPDQLLAAVDNLLAMDMISRKQARYLRLLADQPDPVTIERAGHALLVRAGDRHVRVMSTGAVRYL